jgi:hypothetical protein
LLAALRTAGALLLLATTLLVLAVALARGGAMVARH